LQLAAWSVVPVAVVFFSLVTRPWKFTYAWFCGPILIAVGLIAVLLVVVGILAEVLIGASGPG